MQPDDEFAPGHVLDRVAGMCPFPVQDRGDCLRAVVEQHVVRAEIPVDQERGPVAGAVAARTVANIGLAYDHRLINGRDAAAFLNALKEDLR